MKRTPKKNAAGQFDVFAPCSTCKNANSVFVRMDSTFDKWRGIRRRICLSCAEELMNRVRALYGLPMLPITLDAHIQKEWGDLIASPEKKETWLTLI
jgi:hypothetical protein